MLSLVFYIYLQAQLAAIFPINYPRLENTVKYLSIRWKHIRRSSSFNILMLDLENPREEAEIDNVVGRKTFLAAAGVDRSKKDILSVGYYFQWCLVSMCFRCSFLFCLLLFNVDISSSSLPYLKIQTIMGNHHSPNYSFNESSDQLTDGYQLRTRTHIIKIKTH